MTTSSTFEAGVWARRAASRETAVVPPAQPRPKTGMGLTFLWKPISCITRASIEGVATPVELTVTIGVDLAGFHAGLLRALLRPALRKRSVAPSI